MLHVGGQFKYRFMGGFMLFYTSIEQGNYLSDIINLMGITNGIRVHWIDSLMFLVLYENSQNLSFFSQQVSWRLT